MFLKIKLEIQPSTIGWRYVYTVRGGTAYGAEIQEKIPRGRALTIAVYNILSKYRRKQLVFMLKESDISLVEREFQIDKKVKTFLASQCREEFDPEYGRCSFLDIDFV